MDQQTKRERKAEQTQRTEIETPVKQTEQQKGERAKPKKSPTKNKYYRLDLDPELE